MDERAKAFFDNERKLDEQNLRETNNILEQIGMSPLTVPEENIDFRKEVYPQLSKASQIKVAGVITDIMANSGITELLAQRLDNWVESGYEGSELRAIEEKLNEFGQGHLANVIGRLGVAGSIVKYLEENPDMAIIRDTETLNPPSGASLNSKR